MTKEELRKIGKKMEEKYLPLLIKDLDKETKRLYRIYYKSQRTVGYNNYSDSKIYRLASKETVSEESIEELKRDFDPDYMSNCSTLTEFGYNLEEDMSDMRNAEYEIMKIIMFDENKKKIKTISGTSNKPMNVGHKVKENLLNQTIKTKNCKYAIRVHNHPFGICARTNKQDDKANEKDKEILKEKGIELYDDCIVASYDFYSRK